MLDHNHYTYRVTWSKEDSEYIGLCAEFPSLSWLDKSPEDALKGIRQVVADVVKDLAVNGENVPERLAKVEEFARKIEEGGKHAYSLAEVFPDLIGKGKTIALRAYRMREDFTQRELAEKVGIPQRHISEIETGKRVIGKEMARRFADVLGVDYRALL